MSHIPERETSRLANPSRLTRMEAAIHRLEAKVDALVLALADEAQDDDRGTDMEGNSLPRERDQHEPLGTSFIFADQPGRVG